MSGLSSNAIASDTRPLRPKMQRRPAATYGTKARRIARPAASQIQSTPAEASIGTASKPVTQSDDEDDDIKVRRYLAAMSGEVGVCRLP